jgi:hypothetical protein
MSASASPIIDQAHEERRHEPRPRALKSGRLLFGGFNMSYDVQIRNLAPHGARLHLEANVVLPTEFYLYVVGDAAIARARAIWRTPFEVGIQLLEPLTDPAKHPDHRVQKLQLYRV